MIDRVLQDIKVIDFTQWGAGPFATSQLSDWGAKVIKVEPPQTGDPGRGLKTFMGRPFELPHGRSAFIEAWNRGKESMAVDVKKEEGKEIIRRLVQKSDVFVHNFTSRTTIKLGLDYANLSQHNPRLVYGSCNGFGPKGPEADALSFDLVGQARSGVMMSSGEVGSPPVPLVQVICDTMTGMMLAHGIVLALFAREKFGIGQEVHVSQLQAMMNLFPVNINMHLLTGQRYERHNRIAPQNPLWNYYECKDGRWILLAGLQSERYWPDICKVLDAKELVNDPKFVNAEARAQNSAELTTILQSIFRTKEASQWCALIRDEAEIPHSIINDVADLIDDPQVIANNYIIDLKHPVLGMIKMVGFPADLSKTPGAVQRCAPELGEHTEFKLLDLGYTWDDISRLKDKEVI